jgi:type I restriction enzyme, S subunit
MGKMSIAQQRFLENAVLIAALQLIFKTLEKSDIPLYSLGEIANTTSGGTPDRGRSEYYGGDIPWIKSGELNDGVIEGSEEYITNIGLSNSSAKIYPEGTLVVALYGATVGKTGILAIDAASNQAVCAVTPINEDVNKYFLFWFLRYKRPDFLKSSFGGAQPNISQKILRETILPLPSSNLQRQICAYLEAIESRLKERKSSVIVPHLPAPLSKINSTVQKIEELAAKIEEARGLRREAQDETTQLFKNTLHRIFTDNQNKWSEAMIDSVAEIVDPNPSHRMPQYSETGIPFISTVDFEGPEIIRKSTIKHVTEQTYQEQKERCSFAINDILYSRIGTIGEARILTEIWPFALSHVLVVVKPKKERIFPRFLLWYLRSDSIVIQAHVATRSIGVPDLGIKKIREFSMPLPSLEEQEKLVMLLDNQQMYITQLKQQQSQTSAELNALLPSILDKAFKGEL